MEGSNGGIEVAGFTFVTNFDSANLGKVELVPKNVVIGMNPLYFLNA